MSYSSAHKLNLSNLALGNSAKHLEIYVLNSLFIKVGPLINSFYYYHIDSTNDNQKLNVIRTIAVSDSYPYHCALKTGSKGKMCCGNCSVGENFFS